MIARRHLLAASAALSTLVLAGLPARAQAQAAQPAPVQVVPAPVAPAAPAVDWHTATDLPKVDFTGLTPAQKETALSVLREAGCNCGCNMKLAECRIRDSACPVSPGLAAKVVADVKAGKTAADVKTALASTPQRTPPPPPATLEAQVEIPVEGSPFKGAKSAKVTFVEFSDFQCPFCSRVTPWVDEIAAAYPKDLKVVFKQYPLPMHNQAHLAAQAALSAHAQGKFWELHDKMFANFRTISRDTILTWSKEIGMDVAKVTADLDSGKYKAAVDKDMEHGSKAGVRGTPTFFLNGKKYNGGRDLASIKPFIDAELKGGTVGTTTAAPAVKPAAPAVKPAAPAVKPAVPAAKPADAPTPPVQK